MVDYSSHADRGEEGVQSSLWDQTQQGDTYVPGKDSPQSRVERVKKIVQDVKGQLPNLSPTRDQTQGGKCSTPSKLTTNTAGYDYTRHNGMIADLNGIGQQFQGYDDRQRVRQ